MPPAAPDAQPAAAAASPDRPPLAEAARPLPPGALKPGLAFAVRLAASGSPDTPPPFESAPMFNRAPANNPPAGTASGPGPAATPVIDPAAPAAPEQLGPAQNAPPASPARQAADQPRAIRTRQAAGDGAAAAEDPGSAPSLPEERSVAPAVRAGHALPPQGTSSQARDSENQHLPNDAVPPQSGSTAGTNAVVAPAASGAVASGPPGRTPEAAAPQPAAQPEGPREHPQQAAVRELSLSIPGPASGGQTAEQVSLRVVERAGEVRVAVRASDPQLAGSLRDNLGDLVSNLAGRGYRAETWQPLASSGTDASALPPAGGAAPDSGAGQDSPGQAGDGSRNGGSSSGQQQQQQQQRHGQDPGQPSWLQALARSTARTGSIPYDYAD